MCLYGVAIAASFLTVCATVHYFSLQDPEKVRFFLDRWNPILGGLGAILGGLIVFRSERKVVR
jgi:hypothetical protein